MATNRTTPPECPNHPSAVAILVARTTDQTPSLSTPTVWARYWYKKKRKTPDLVACNSTVPALPAILRRSTIHNALSAKPASGQLFGPSVRRQRLEAIVCCAWTSAGARAGELPFVSANFDYSFHLFRHANKGRPWRPQPRAGGNLFRVLRRRLIWFLVLRRKPEIYAVRAH